MHNYTEITFFLGSLNRIYKGGLANLTNWVG